MVSLECNQGRKVRMSEQRKPRLLPTGECWCGCGAELPVGSFFAAGHDKRAEARVIAEQYENIPGFLAAHGYAPGGEHWKEGSR
jgi:hypothetical protein